MVYCWAEVRWYRAGENHVGDPTSGPQVDVGAPTLRVWKRVELSEAEILGEQGQVTAQG